MEILAPKEIVVLMDLEPARLEEELGQTSSGIPEPFTHCLARQAVIYLEIQKNRQTILQG